MITDSLIEANRKRQEQREALLADDSICVWGEFGDDLEMDVSTKCGHAMMEYDGDEQYWELDDGDKCPFCGKPIKRVWGWVI